MERLPSLLALAAFLVAAFHIQRALARSPRFWRVALESAPTACALILLGIGLFGRAFHSFDLGVYVGAGAAALAGGCAWWRNRGAKLDFRLSLSWQDLPLLLFAACSTVAVAWIAWKCAIHDERVVQGHPAMVESMLRGTYPLYFLPFPEIPNKYHVGYNVVAALFSKALGLPGYQGVDVAAVFLWVGLLGALASLLGDLKVPRALWGLGLAFVVFTGGLSWILGGNDPNQYQVPGWQVVSIAGRWVHYTFLFYFYQHPMSLGALLFVGVVHLFHRWSERGGWGLLAAVALGLGALSLAHVMFFATLLAALGAVFFIRLLQRPSAWRGTVAAGLAVFFVSVGLAFALGGFFQPPSPQFDAEAMRFAWPPGYLRYEYFGGRKPMSAAQAALWYLDGFGVFLLVLPPALYLCLRDRRPALWLLGIYCGLSLLIPQFVYYNYSSNIQKWFLGFEFSGKILAAALLLPYCLVRRRQALAYALVGFAMAAPLIFVYGMTLKDPAKLNWGERRAVYNRHSAPQGSFLKVVEILKRNAREIGMTWTTSGMARYIAVYAGYPVLEPDNVVSMPVARKILDERRERIRRLFTQPSDALLGELRIRWVIFSCEERAKLAQPVQDFLEGLKIRPGVLDLSFGGNAPGCYTVLKLPPPGG